MNTTAIPLDSEEGLNISILCVEDEPLTRKILGQILAMKYSAYKILTAKNGKEGLEKFRKISAEVVLTDLNMPVMNGVQMAREIRRVNPNVCIIALSAYNSMKDRAEDFDRIFSDYMSKPIIPKKLFATIENCLVQKNQDLDE